MSKKKRRTREQKINYQQNRLLKIQELERLRMEIINLEKEISVQKKNKRVKNLRIFGCAFKRIVMPIVLVTGISLGAGQLINIGMPFKRDKIVHVKETNIEYETDKKLDITEHYVMSGGILGTKTVASELKIFFPCEQKENGYEQTVRTYKLIGKNKERIYKAILENNLKNEVEDLLYIYEDKIDMIEEITETDKGYIVKCNINLLNKDDKLYVEESKKVSDIIDLVYLLIFVLGSAYIIKFDKFFDAILVIENDYNFVSIKDLKKELSDKKIQYSKKKNGV